MNAETRAKELFDIIVDKDPRHWVVILTAAVTRAENDKLEEAADAATKFLVGDPFNGVPLRSPGPHEIAAHIRSLKSKD